MAIETPIIGTIEAIEPTNHGRSTGRIIKTQTFCLSLPFFAKNIVEKLQIGDDMEIEPQTNSGLPSKNCLTATFTREVDEIKKTIEKISIFKNQVFSLK